MPTFRILNSMLVPANTPSAPTLRSGHIPAAAATIDCGVYIEGKRQPGSYTHEQALAMVRESAHPVGDLAKNSTAKNAFIWIGLHEPNEHQMKEVGQVFGLHSLAIEDVVLAHQRPKLERYDETLFLVLKTVNYVPHESVTLAREIVQTGEVMIFVGNDFVITVRHGEHGGLSEVRKRLDADPDKMRLGPYVVMHAIADHVVDHYLAVTNLMAMDIDAIEEATFAPGTRTDVEPIYLIKREVVELRRCVHPLTVPFNRMQTEHKDLIGKEVRRYLRDVADHQAQAAEQISSYSETLSSLAHAALAKAGMQQNIDMRKISAWAGIVAVPTMIAGIYGMNFEFMPELHWAWGYLTVLIVMTVVCGLLYHNFRHKNWL